MTVRFKRVWRLSVASAHFYNPDSPFSFLTVCGNVCKTERVKLDGVPVAMCRNCLRALGFA